MSTLLLASAILPVIVSVVSAVLWWSSLSRPWTFALAAIVVAYLLMGLTVMFALQGIGIAGGRSGQPSFGPAERHFVIALVAYIAVVGALQFGLKVLFRRA